MASGSEKMTMHVQRSYARRTLEASFRRFVRDNKKFSAVLVSVLALMVALVVATQHTGFGGGFVVGVAVAALGAVFLFAFLLSTGSIFSLVGVLGESFTKDDIKTALKRGEVWGAVHNIEIGAFDIDHLVVCPRGLFAIETKAHIAKVDAKRRRAAIEQAKHAARKAEQLMMSAHVKRPSVVSPVLVVWGKRANRDIPSDGREVDGVYVLAGPDLPAWLATQAAGPLAKGTAEELLRLVTAFKDTRALRTPVLA
jgi:hypothetical protein